LETVPEETEEAAVDIDEDELDLEEEDPFDLESD